MRNDDIVEAHKMAGVVRLLGILGIVLSFVFMTMIRIMMSGPGNEEISWLAFIGYSLAGIFGTATIAGLLAGITALLVPWWWMNK